nr:hypothetical protein PIFADJLK_00035 [Oryctes rhinoceros nudivirus]
MNTALHRCAVMAEKFPKVCCLNVSYACMRVHILICSRTHIHAFIFFSQLYMYLCNHEPALIFYSPQSNPDNIPPNYFHVRYLEEANLLGGVAMLYSKKIIVATNSYDTIQSSDHLYVTKL